jgi:hypothetical protein
MDVGQRPTAPTPAHDWRDGSWFRREGQVTHASFAIGAAGQADDQFRGPAPDDAHFTGAIFRLNPNGPTRKDNPFAGVTAFQPSQIASQAGVTLTSTQLKDVVANVHKVFS